MATITGLTAARMLAIEAASVVDGDVVGDDLILTRHDGSTINAGNVKGDQGIAGPAGSDLVVVTARDILDVGASNQIRAGRQLTAADFTNMGLAAPTGLWNLSTVSDSSGNGRNLTNKGTVTFAKGINGTATTAAQFIASTSQALYIADTGASDPFRLRTGTFGCWFRTGKKVGGVYQVLISKTTYPSDGQMSYWLEVGPDGKANANFCADGLIANKVNALSSSDVADDRWHFAVMVYDGTRGYLYIDSVMEATTTLAAGLLFASNGPFNIGSSGANAGLTGSLHFAGRIDEAFVTSEILSEDQIRNLYCAKISHSLGAVPKRSALNVRRRKRGAALATTDFPATPLRLYNFSGGVLTDQGSNATALTISGTGATVVAGADGAAGNAYDLSGGTTFLQATDTGLPSGVASRSYGLWLKYTPRTGNHAVMGWGSSASTTAAQAIWIGNDGTMDSMLFSRNIDNAIGGIFCGDGRWHFVVVVEDNTAADGMKRKLYIDGICVAQTTLLTSISLGGANRFKLGVWPDGAGSSFRGQIDSAFVYNGALDPAEIAVLYAKGAQSLGISPKNPGDHIEMMTSTDLYCAFDLESQHQIDLAVA